MRLAQQSLPILLQSLQRPLLALGASGILWLSSGCGDSLAGNPPLTADPAQPAVSARTEAPLSGEPAVAPRVDSGATILGVLRCSTSSGNPGTEGNAASGEGEYPVVSGDGNVVAFESLASNLVPDDTNNAQDVFVRDLTSDTTTRILSSSDRANPADRGQQPNAPVYKPSLSQTGQYISFESAADNLIDGDTNGTRDIFVLDRSTGIITRVSVYANGAQSSTTSSQSSISADGKRVAFISDQPLAGTPAGGGIFVRDLRGTTPTTIMASVNSNNQPINNGTEAPKISADGGHVAFWANTNNGVPGDPVGFYQPDVYVRDLPGSTTKVGTTVVTYPTGRTIRASNNDQGQRGNDQSAHPSISADGRYVSYWSEATNLAPNATPDRRNIYWHDTVTLKTRCCSLTSAGNPAALGDTQFSKISANGEWVAFTSSAPDLNTYSTGEQVYVCNIKSPALETRLISTNGSNQPANGGSRVGGISDDGSRIVFGSIANNLVSNDTNAAFDVFIKTNPVAPKKTTSLSTTLVSSNALGEPGNYSHQLPSSSHDGRYVAFVSDSSNLVANDTNNSRDIFVKDRQSGLVERVSTQTGGGQAESEAHSSISADGRYVSFASRASNLPGANGRAQVYRKDRQNNTTELISADSSGISANEHSYRPSISSDGRYVAFSTPASNLVAGDTNNQEDIFIKDTQTGAIVRASTDGLGLQGDGRSYYPRLSGDGRYVAFISSASNLVAGDTNNREDIFIKNLQDGSIENLTLGGSSLSYDPSLSADGRYVAFSSYASNLVTGDTNSESDIFLKDRQLNTLQRISRSSAGAQANGTSYDPRISADGRYVTYMSYATNLVAGDTNGVYDTFVYDREKGTTQRFNLTANGGQTNASGTEPTISPDGLLVFFRSSASNLGANDFGQIFVRSRP